jgi:hypothetical protein
LFFDYVYKVVKVEDILTIRNWGALNGGHQADKANSIGTSAMGSGESFDATKSGVEEPEMNGRERDNEIEKVLVIEAFGVADNEVLARAWCSHWGLGAVVADVERTW